MNLENGTTEANEATTTQAPPPAKVLESWQSSRMIDIRQHVRLGHYGEGRSRVGFNIGEDINFLIETIDYLQGVKNGH